MADHTVIVRLQAEVSAYKARMKEAAAATSSVGASAEKSAVVTSAASKKQATAATAASSASVAGAKRQATASSAAAAATTKHTSALRLSAAAAEKAGRASQMAGGAILLGVGAALVTSTKAASDLTETMNKSAVTFGKHADAMTAWGKTAAQTMGLSTQEALAVASTFGDMFTQLGYGSGKAAQLSQTVVQLSADLGSFHNLPTAEVG